MILTDHRLFVTDLTKSSVSPISNNRIMMHYIEYYTRLLHMHTDTHIIYILVFENVFSAEMLKKYYVLILLNSNLKIVVSDDHDIVIIHDGVRPVLTENILKEVTEAAYTHGVSF